MQVPESPREEGEDTRTALETVRGMPETALVFAFLCSFGEALKLPRTSVHDLERALAGDEDSKLLDNVIKVLVKELVERGRVEANLNRTLRKIIRAHIQVGDVGAMTPNPLDETDDYFDLPAHDKVVVLSWLCDWALQESDRVVAHLGERAEGKSLTPIGEDSAGFSYWHFGAHSSRIYRDGARVPEGAPEDQWTIVADSAVEMGNLAEGLRKSDSARERALARTISESILPAFLVESKKKLPPVKAPRVAREEVDLGDIIFDEGRQRRSAAKQRPNYKRFFILVNKDSSESDSDNDEKADDYMDVNEGQRRSVRLNSHEPRRSARYSAAVHSGGESGSENSDDDDDDDDEEQANPPPRRRLRSRQGPPSDEDSSDGDELNGKFKNKKSGKRKSIGYSSGEESDEAPRIVIEVSGAENSEPEDGADGLNSGPNSPAPPSRKKTKITTPSSAASSSSSPSSKRARRRAPSPSPEQSDEDDLPPLQEEPSESDPLSPQSDSSEVDLSFLLRGDSEDNLREVESEEEEDAVDYEALQEILLEDVSPKTNKKKRKTAYEEEESDEEFKDEEELFMTRKEKERRRKQAIEAKKQAEEQAKKRAEEAALLDASLLATHSQQPQPTAQTPMHHAPVRMPSLLGDKNTAPIDLTGADDSAARVTDSKAAVASLAERGKKKPKDPNAPPKVNKPRAPKPPQALQPQPSPSIAALFRQYTPMVAGANMWALPVPVLPYPPPPPPPPPPVKVQAVPSRPIQSPSKATAPSVTPPSPSTLFTPHPGQNLVHILPASRLNSMSSFASNPFGGTGGGQMWQPQPQ